MWTVRIGEFQSKSRLCKGWYFCAGWCICHGESCCLSFVLECVCCYNEGAHSLWPWIMQLLCHYTHFTNALLSWGFFWGLISSCCFPLLFNALINIGYQSKRSNTQMSWAGEGLGCFSAFTSKTFLLPVSLCQIIGSYQKDVYSSLFQYHWWIPLALERNIFLENPPTQQNKQCRCLWLVSLGCNINEHSK